LAVGETGDGAGAPLPALITLGRGAGVFLGAPSGSPVRLAENTTVAGWPAGLLSGRSA
jgi:hypothetical protein